MVAPRFHRLVVDAYAGEKRVIMLHGAYHSDQSKAPAWQNSSRARPVVPKTSSPTRHSDCLERTRPACWRARDACAIWHAPFVARFASPRSHYQVMQNQSNQMSSFIVALMSIIIGLGVTARGLWVGPFTAGRIRLMKFISSSYRCNPVLLVLQWWVTFKWQHNSKI